VTKNHAWVVFACLMINCGQYGEPTPPPAPIRDGGVGNTMDAQIMTPPNPARCTGVATGCALLTGATCGSAKGCILSERCTGYARSCSSFYGLCIQDGCYRDGSGQCTGFAWHCGTYTSQTACGYQDGCSWTGDCLGDAAQCSSLSAADCLSQPGCHLQM
jgi:hypothetical protein